MNNIWNWKWLFEPIKNESDAIQVLGSISKLWYFMSVLYGIIGLVLIVINKLSGAFIFDVLICLYGGYYLLNQKSRTFAIFLFSYALLITILTIMSNIGVYTEGMGGKNIILALSMVAMGYRGVWATYVYHRSVNSKISWKNVLIVFFIIVLLSVILLLAFMFILVTFNFESQKPYELFVPIYMLIIGFTLGILAKRFPFAKSLGN